MCRRKGEEDALGEVIKEDAREDSVRELAIAAIGGSDRV